MVVLHMIKEINEQDLLKMKDKEGLILQGCGGVTLMIGFKELTRISQNETFL